MARPRTKTKRGAIAAAATVAALGASLPADAHSSRKASPIAWPSKGAGRKRNVEQGSLDELAAKLAHEIAAACVDEIRVAVDSMARATLVKLLGKR